MTVSRWINVEHVNGETVTISTYCYEDAMEHALKLQEFFYIKRVWFTQQVIDKNKPITVKWLLVDNTFIFDEDSLNVDA